MPILEYKDIAMCYHMPTGETEVLKDFSLSVAKGEFIALVGPSGCGKSTLLSLAAGLLSPDAGEVLYRGAKITAPLRNMGYMLQKDELFPWLTVMDNCMLGLKVRGEDDKEHRQYVEMLLENCAISTFKNNFPSELSGGMRQRAALVRTLAVRPDFLLLDEPFSALDAQTRVKLADELSQTIKGHTAATLLVTHDIAEAVSLATRVIVLSRRPALIKTQVNIDIPGFALQRRGDSRFKEYFEEIWKQVDVHVE